MPGLPNCSIVRVCSVLDIDTFLDWYVGFEKNP